MCEGAFCIVCLLVKPLDKLSMLTGEVFLSCPNVTFEHSVLRFKGKLSNTFTTDHTGVYCVMISESSAMIVASLPHVNVYLFFPHSLSLSLSLSLSPSLPSLSPSFLLAASSLVLGITVLIRTYLLDGLISLFLLCVCVCVCVCVWVWCDDGGHWFEMVILMPLFHQQ